MGIDTSAIQYPHTHPDAHPRRSRFESHPHTAHDAQHFDEIEYEPA